MTFSIAVASLLIAIMSSTMTLFISWLIRRDAAGRANAAESSHIEDLERRVRWIEENSVSLRDFNSLVQRLDAIQADVREIRSYQLQHPRA